MWRMLFLLTFLACAATAGERPETFCSDGVEAPRDTADASTAAFRAMGRADQIAFGTNRTAARAVWTRLRPACRSAAPKARLDYVPVRRKGPEDRIYLMVRVGADTRNEAAQICRAVARAGCPCRAFRN